MVEKSRWLAVICVAALLVFVPGCSDDDDDIIPTGPVNANQAAAVIGGLVVPAVGTLMTLAEVLSPLKAAQAECAPLGGIEADFYCTPPDSGEVCLVDVGTTDVNFDNCMGEDGDDIDGNIRVIQDGNSFAVTFNGLTINGQDYGGSAALMYDDCDIITMSNFAISDGATVTMNGDFTICGDVPGGNANGLVTGSGFLPFTLIINITEGFVTITVIDNATELPLFLCTYNPLTEQADCVDYDQF